MTTEQGQKVKGQRHKVMLRISSKSAITRQQMPDGRINLKLGGNFHHEGGNM